jgi:hypothetical protein
MGIRERKALIYNIIDHRERPYRWKRINAIIEATSHDNTVADTDIAEPPPPEVEMIYDQREGISLNEAISWAHAEICPVTLYLYDEGKGTTPSWPVASKH